MSEEKLLNQEEEQVQETAVPVPSEKDKARGRILEPKWYVVHTYSGHEKKVKTNLERLVISQGMEDQVLEIYMPEETVYEHKDGTPSKPRQRKLFPGYILVKMIVTDESWYLVRNTQGVTGFVGHGSEPIPLTDEEVRRMGLEKVTIVMDINVGDHVQIISGPLMGHGGVVEEINADKQTLKTKVDMFGRYTPVELEFSQVDKL